METSVIYTCDCEKDNKGRPLTVQVTQEETCSKCGYYAVAQTLREPLGITEEEWEQI